MKQLPLFLQSRFLLITSFVYLLIPFLLFVLFWVKLIFALPITLILLYCLFISYKELNLKQVEYNQNIENIRKNWIIGFCIILFWLLFSGIGNLSYQNSDYNIRNAVMRDLVEQSWPVTYSSDIYPVDRRFTENRLMLVYYFGYWLPAAFIGKFAGLTAANLFLFFWSLLGILIAYSLLSQTIKRVSYKAVIILIIWSGLDIIGTLSAKYLTTSFIFHTHLEHWADNFKVYAQFSSITTLLYWVFNQTIPLWITVLLFFNNSNVRTIFLIIALSLFLAPIGTLGFIPFVLLRIGQQIYQNGFISVLNRYASLANTLGALFVIGITGLFFSTNRAGSMKSLVFFDIVPYTAFIVLEVGILTFLLFFYYRNKLALVCFGFLCFIPLIKVGRYYDFAMRASISYLFLLCILTIKFLLDAKANNQGKLLMLVYLSIGCITPIFEITRSVIYTSNHFLFLTKEKLNSYELSSEMPIRLKTLKDRDFIYDRIKTFSRHNQGIDHTIDQFIGESENNFFADYLLRKNVKISDVTK